MPTEIVSPGISERYNLKKALIYDPTLKAQDDQSKIPAGRLAAFLF